jgi:hypothetical protein
VSAVVLGAIEPFVFRPTVTWDHDGACCGSCDADADAGYYVGEHCCCRAVERTVPPVVPSFIEPCENCGGSGLVPDLYDVEYLTCPTCGGTGTVQRVWRAERQVLCEESGFQGGMDNLWTAAFPHERRLAVVSWYPVTVLTYIGDDWSPERTARGDDRGLHPDDAKPRIATRFGDVLVFDGGPVGRKVTDEPWAADLVPGCVVAIPGDEVRLDTPITEMVDLSEHSHGFVNRTAPLALTDGLNVVELAR